MEDNKERCKNYSMQNWDLYNCVHTQGTSTVQCEEVAMFSYAINLLEFSLNFYKHILC